MAAIYGGKGIDPRHGGYVSKTHGNVFFRSHRISSSIRNESIVAGKLNQIHMNFVWKTQTDPSMTLSW